MCRAEIPDKIRFKEKRLFADCYIFCSRQEGVFYINFIILRKGLTGQLLYGLRYDTQEENTG